jgi:16S rRNA (cytosine967-C5)-methyltransferase
VDPLNVRISALKILNALEQPAQTLDMVLERFRRQKPFAFQRDRALLQKIVFGVLRWRVRLDYIIGSFSNTPLKKIQPEILNVLRIGTFQIVHLNRIPASAAVNTSVELAKTLAPAWVVRFVNAVLHKVVTGHKEVQYPSVDVDPVMALSVNKSFPPWLIRRWMNRFALDETLRLCDALNTIPPITLRANTLKIDRTTLLQMLVKQDESVQAATHAPDGVLLCHPRQALAELEAFQMGFFQVQDEAAQLVSLLLAPKPGERVLDACAGLGGKTGHIAQLMHNKGVIVASDIIAGKLKNLSVEMIRLGITIVTTHQTNLLQDPPGDGLGVFDRVLVDAPCSGLGVLRRNPDAKWTARQHMFGKYSNRQKALLNKMAPLVKPGGILVYAVCSNEPEEGQKVIEYFLERHADFRLDVSAETSPCTETPSFGHGGILKTYPHRHNMDGFFAARFRRI